MRSWSGCSVFRNGNARAPRSVFHGVSFSTVDTIPQSEAETPTRPRGPSGDSIPFDGPLSCRSVGLCAEPAVTVRGGMVGWGSAAIQRRLMGCTEADSSSSVGRILAVATSWLIPHPPSFTPIGGVGLFGNEGYSTEFYGGLPLAEKGLPRLLKHEFVLPR